MFVISHDGRRAYTSNVGPGTVSVLDLVARKTIKVIPVAKTDQRISASIDDGLVFTADQDQPRLAVIDTTQERSYAMDLPAFEWIRNGSYAGRPLAAGYAAQAEPDRGGGPVADEGGANHRCPGASRTDSHAPRSSPGLCLLQRRRGSRGGRSQELAGVRTMAAGPGADGLAWANRQ